MAITFGRRNTTNRDGWRRLGGFWLTVLSLIAVGSVGLAWLGPPVGDRREAVASKPPDPVRIAVAVVPPVAAVARPIIPVVTGRDTPGPVTDPEPGLLEPLAEGSPLNLPRIASDGRTAMKVYAAGFDHSSRRPRIGLLLAGIGMNEVESEAAIRVLPGAVSLAVSPYAAMTGLRLTKLLAAARTNGHEYLIEIPLEPAGFPLNDPGPSALLTTASAPANERNLRWALSRIDGYVGAAGVTGTMRGERLAAMTDQMDAVLSELSERGLLYLDPRESVGSVPRGVSKAWGRHVDLVIDEPADQGAADRGMIDAKLAALEQRARDTGAALGLITRPTPVVVAGIAAWSNRLVEHGLTLAPVSALAVPPADKPVKLSERD
jgi:polysaccharide deacetylase 2 family uncharacterized protein YibQ